MSETENKISPPTGGEEVTNRDSGRHTFDNFSLKVKKDFIISDRPESLGPLPESSIVAVVEEETTDDRDSKKKKKKRGRNKKRPRDARQDDSEKMCLAFVQGKECKYGEDKCRYSHDLKAFMANRPADIKEVDNGMCPMFKARGYCIYGITCRIGGCHLTKDGENVKAPEATELPEDKPRLSEDVMNKIPGDVQIQLRKKTFPFKCKRHFEKQTEETVKTDPTTTNNTPMELKTRKIIDFSNKVYVAPLTTVGNLPFRRVMKRFGADITCSEMALATGLLEGKTSEWALVKRHPEEDIFGIQLAAGHPDQFTRVSEVIEKYTTLDFLDLNLGCPLDLVCNKGAGAALMMRDSKLKGALEGISQTVSCPITIKIRTGWDMEKPFAHKLVPKIQSWNVDGVAAIMLHGRSRLQRYQRLANWDYIGEVVKSQSTEMKQIPIIGNGDIFSYSDYEEKVAREGISATAMLGRGALIKPWLPTEIKERRHWDISASERLDILKDFVRFGLEHWGSDQQGVNNCRRFLLEWLSFLHRYVPVGLLEVLPQQMNHRPPPHMIGRSDLETLFLSPNSHDWIKISEMVLGPVDKDFKFEPKHKANGYA